MKTEDIYEVIRCLKTFDFVSNFLLLGFVSSDYPWAHPEPLKNLIDCIVILHETNIFWCWLLYLGQWAENQRGRAK